MIPLEQSKILLKEQNADWNILDETGEDTRQVKSMDELFTVKEKSNTKTETPTTVNSAWECYTEKDSSPGQME